MDKVFLVSLGDSDRLLGDALARLAAHAQVDAASVCRLDRLAERALAPGDEVLQGCFLGAGRYVIGCSRPRAVRALLAFAGVRFGKGETVEWVPLPFDRDVLQQGYGVPWYPVIDPTVCSNCGTCHDYCLFSVYAKGERNEIRVSAPLNCKTGCPACARLCPEQALIFPFSPEAELNGEVERPVHRDREMLAEALGDDPMRMLAERRRRKGLVDPEKFGRAEQDRIRYSGVL